MSSTPPPVLGRRVERDPATAVFARQVKPGRETEYERLAQQMLDASASFPGQLGATMLHEPGSASYTLVYNFTDRSSLDQWLHSPQRRRLTAMADRLAESHLRVPPLTGLETWFTLPHQETIKPPPRWKMWLVSLLAIYPLVVAFQGLLVPKIKAWPLLARSAILPFTLLTLMTFIVMPVVTRLLHPWLSSRG